MPPPRTPDDQAGPAATAVGLAAAIAAGDLDPAGVVAGALAAARSGPWAPAFASVDESVAEVAVGAAPAAGGSLRGVPVAVKDYLAHQAGHPYWCGSPLLEALDHRASFDSAVIRRLRAAGAVVIGRTVLPELATSFTTTWAARPPLAHPFVDGASPWGSSGGSAVAVAAGVVPVAHANDMAGSVRAPAAACALVGAKPSRGFAVVSPWAPERWFGFAHDGALATTVADAARLLDVMAGAGGHPAGGSGPGGLERAAARGPAGRLRVGVLVAAPGGLAEVDPACVAAVGATATALADLGHEVVEVRDGPLVEPAELTTLVGVVVARTLRWWGHLAGRPLTGDDVERRNWALAELGNATTGDELVAALARRDAHAAALAGVFAPRGERVAGAARRRAGDGVGVDLVVSPTMPVPCVPLGWERSVRRADLVLGCFTAPWNVGGQPAWSLPLGATDDGRPVGVQLVGGRGRDDLVAAVAAELEGHLGWAVRRPRG